jgi:hypothetical protein
MPLTSAAETELRQMLRDFRAAHRGAVIPTGAGKALEAWVLFKLAHNVHLTMSGSWQVSLRRGDGTALPSGATFALPKGSAKLPASRRSAPGYILLEHGRHSAFKVELHLNLRWQGRSNTKHELDVSALPHAIGNALRANGGGYPNGLPILAIECKDKGRYGELDETRQKLARMYDLVLVTRPAAGWSCRIFETAANTRWGRRSSKYTAAFRIGTFDIARLGTFRKGAKTLADHYSIGQYDNILRASMSTKRLESSFRHSLAIISTF